MKCKDCTDIECKRRGDPNMKCFYEEDSQEELEENYNWQSFRNQAAKDILAGMMQHKVLSDSSTTLFIPKEKVVSAAIGLADELIKQLKEKEEK